MALAGLAQAFLPGLAANRIRERIERYGTVSRVTVRAFPAIALLWGRADSVNIQADHLKLSQKDLASLTSQAGGLQDLELSARRLSLTGLPLARAPLDLRDVRLGKRGRRLHIRAAFGREALARVLPEGVAVKVENPAAGGPAGPARGVALRVAGALFGMRAGLRVKLAPVDGALVARPEGIVGDLISLKLFSDPELEIDGISARESEHVPPGGGYLVELSARTRAD